MGLLSGLLGNASVMDNNEVQKQFAKHKVDARPFFYPISSMPAYRHHIQSKMKKRNPVSYGISPYGVCLPAAATLTEKEVHYVCDVFKKILKKK